MRRRIRVSKPEFDLYSAGGPLGVRKIRRVTAKVGDALVRERKAQLIQFGSEFVFQLLSDGQRAVLPKEPCPSSTAFSNAELEAIAGIRGESRTTKMNEPQRLKRIAKGLGDMDLVEASREKLSVYQEIH